MTDDDRDSLRGGLLAAEPFDDGSGVSILDAGRGRVFGSALGARGGLENPEPIALLEGLGGLIIEARENCCLSCDTFAPVDGVALDPCPCPCPCTEVVVAPVFKRRFDLEVDGVRGIRDSRSDNEGLF